MSALGWAVVAVPLAGGAAAVLLRRRAWGGRLALAAAVAALGLAVVLPWRMGAGALLRVDALAGHMAVALAVAALLALWLGRASGAAAAQVLGVLAGLELAVLADGPALAWVGLEAALLGLLLGGARGGEAAWRAVATVVPALALALLGGLLFWLAAGGARPWAALAEAAPGLSADVLSLGWMLWLAGLAPAAGLAPLHGWMRAAGRGTAAAAMVPGLAAVALVLLLHGREVVMAQDGAVEPGPPLLALGLASLAWAALGLWRERRPARDAALFAGGLAAVGFGLGGDAVAAALLLLTLLVALGPLVALAAGWARAGALAALALLPPCAGFGAAVALLGEAADAMPWLAVPLGALMVAGAGGLARAAWQARPGAVPPRVALPAGLVLALAVAAGVVPAVAAWFGMLAEGAR